MIDLAKIVIFFQTVTANGQFFKLVIQLIQATFAREERKRRRNGETEKRGNVKRGNNEKKKN
jgi:hypothetical protein